MMFLAISSALLTYTAAFSQAPITAVGRNKAACTTTRTKLTKNSNDGPIDDRRAFLNTAFLSTAAAAAAAATTTMIAPAPACAEEVFDVDSFIKTGMVANPMGVSSQAGKSRPETNVVLREGTDVARDSRSGGVVAEILLKGAGDPPTLQAVLTSFESPWPLAKGTVFDVECRDAASGDGAFLAVTPPLGPGGGGGGSGSVTTIADVPTNVLLNELFKSTGRFSFYGVPTDIKLKKFYDSESGTVRFLEVGFSTLSQSTQTEIPRRAIIAATVPLGSESAVMLTGSATATRWKKGAEQDIRKVVASFQALPAPKSNMVVRAKVRGYEL